MMREGHASDAKRDICLPGWAAAGYSDGSRFASTATLHFWQAPCLGSSPSPCYRRLLSLRSNRQRLAITSVFKIAARRKLISHDP